MTAILAALKAMGPTGQKYLDALEHILLGMLFHAMGQIAWADTAFLTGLTLMGWTLPAQVPVAPVIPPAVAA